MVQVSENRKELHDAVMHDAIFRESGRLLGRKECGIRDVENAQLGSSRTDGIGAGKSHSLQFSMSVHTFSHSFYKHFLFCDVW